MISKRYLGDGVFADVNDYGIVLTTEDGSRETNTIELEPAVIRALDEFLADYRRALAKREN